MPTIQEILQLYTETGQPPANGGLEGNYIQPEGALGAQSSYNFNSRVFPLDLGMDHNKHYVVFNINVPVASDGKVKPTGDTKNADFANITPLSDLSKVDQLRFNDGNPGFWDSFRDKGANADLPRYTRRIAESIAMHMPTPLVYTHKNLYADVSLSSFAAQAGSLALGKVGKAMARSGTEGNRRDILGNLISGTGDVIGNALRLSGNPINPRIEVLFSNTLQRQFAFEFLMAPRNEEESIAMDMIIRTFKFHGAPTINRAGLTDVQTGSWWDQFIGWSADAAKFAIPFYIPPAEFDITFFNNGQENTNIPRINTCVLESIEVDYQPQGMYATFSNGYPVAARLSMSFRETEVIHKERVAQGF